VDKNLRTVDVPNCPSCGQEMEFDDLDGAEVEAGDKVIVHLVCPECGCLDALTLVPRR
jgi:predicted RNA-binding Zn-ribbon protein involved in translation (DUF1610 family)